MSVNQTIEMAVVANPFGKTTNVLSKLATAGIRFRVFRSLRDYHDSSPGGNDCPVLMEFRDSWAVTAQCIEDLRKGRDLPVYIFADSLDTATIRQLFLAGADDVVNTGEIDENLLSKWMNIRAISLRNERERIREFERVVRRGSFLEESIADGQLPNYYKNTNRIEFLRCDVTNSNKLEDSWRHVAVSEWIREFGGSASFVFLRPNSFLGLRIGAMVDIDEENRALFLNKLTHRLNRYFDAISIHGCICAASSCNAEYLDYFVANALDMQNEQVFYLHSSQYIPNRQVRNSYVVDNTEYERFGELLIAGNTNDAAALLAKVVHAVCESRPKPVYAYEVMRSFAKVIAAVYGQDTTTLLPFPSRNMNIFVMKDQLLEKIRLLNALPLQNAEPVIQGNQQIINIASTIKLNPAHHYTAEETASQLGYSRSHFCRVFSASIGESFGSYVKKHKLLYAGDLLKRTNFSIKEVGNIVGYPNTPYFRKIFEDQHQCSPEKYRMRM